MFNNIGRKLKKFAKFVVIAGTILCVIIGIAMIVGGGTDLDNIDGGYNNINGEYTKISGWMYLIGGTFTALANGLLLYGFGEMIEINQRMYKLMLRKGNSAELQSSIEDDVWVCEECGNVNKNTSATCAKCGAAWEAAGYNPSA